MLAVLFVLPRTLYIDSQCMQLCLPNAALRAHPTHPPPHNVPPESVTGEAMRQIHPIDNCRATERRFSGGRTIANRQGQGVPSRHEPGERALILAECWLGVALRGGISS